MQRDEDELAKLIMIKKLWNCLFTEHFKIFLAMFPVNGFFNVSTVAAFNLQYLSFNLVLFMYVLTYIWAKSKLVMTQNFTPAENIAINFCL